MGWWGDDITTEDQDAPDDTNAKTKSSSLRQAKDKDECLLGLSSDMVIILAIIVIVGILLLALGIYCLFCCQPDREGKRPAPGYDVEQPAYREEYPPEMYD